MQYREGKSGWKEGDRARGKERSGRRRRMDMDKNIKHFPPPLLSTEWATGKKYTFKNSFFCNVKFPYVIPP